jgi:positive regulator of sigma E activity
MPTNGKITEKKNGKVYIQIDEDMSACKGCAAHALCGKKDCSDAQITLKDRSDLNIGDRVVIEEKDNILIKTSLLAYGIPMLFFIAGIFLGLLIPDMSLPKELLQFLSGCVFMVLGGFLGRWLAQKLSQSIDKYFLINVNNQQ